MAKEFKESDYDLAIDADVECRVRNVHVDGNPVEEKIGGNGNPYFPPASFRLRGEIRFDRMHTNNVPGALSQVGGVIPGQRVLVDTKARHAKIIDLLSLPENAWKVQELKRLGETDRYYFGRFGRVLPDMDFSISAADWSKWMYWLRRLVDEKNAKLVRGPLPSAEQCLKLGEVTLANHVGAKSLDAKNPFNVLRYETPELATAKN